MRAPRARVFPTLKFPKNATNLHRAYNLSPRCLHHLAGVALQEGIRPPRAVRDLAEARRRAPMTALWETPRRRGQQQVMQVAREDWARDRSLFAFCNGGHDVYESFSVEDLGHHGWKWLPQ